jgi:YesN/AraC family two-component response regulator
MEKVLLIVEDEAELRELLVEICSAFTSHIETASNGFSALEIIQNKRVDAVLSDLNMPVMGGMELLKKIRELGMETPFIFLSGYGEREDIVKALQFGAFHYFEKPYGSTEFMVNLQLALDLGSALNELQTEIQFCQGRGQVASEKLMKLQTLRQKIWEMKKGLLPSVGAKRA